MTRPSSAQGKEGRLARKLREERVRVCEGCIANGERVSVGCYVDGDIACGVCGVRPSRGVIGLREMRA